MLKKNIKSVLMLTLSSIIIGIICGFGGSVFHLSTEIVNDIRVHNSWLIYFLPVAGLLLVWIYKICKIPPDTNTKPVFIGARKGEKVNPLLALCIFIATCLTHLFGGSAGREGAALQFGGSLGSATGQILKFDRSKNKIAVLCGMAAGFTAMFGTPVTSAVFVFEATDVTLGMLYTSNFIYIIISVFIATVISSLFGAHGMNFTVPELQLDIKNILATILISIACAIITVVFILSKKYVKKYSVKYITNDYLRIAIGGVLIVVLSIIWSSGDYNGVGTNVIANAMNGNVKAEAFILKLIFTVITLSFGFKGGELVPIFFIGATLGGFIAGVLGISVAVGAAIGMVCIFSASTDCPISAIILGIEVFGYHLAPFFLISCVISYYASGNIDFYDKKLYKFEDKI